jgi:hypothetical protein
MEPQSKQRLAQALAHLASDRTDEDAWRSLLDCSWATALSTANRILRGELEIARDVAQEAFQRVVRYCDFRQLQDPDAFLLYLKAISRIRRYSTRLRRKMSSSSMAPARGRWQAKSLSI